MPHMHFGRQPCMIIYLIEPVGELTECRVVLFVPFGIKNLMSWCTITWLIPASRIICPPLQEKINNFNAVCMYSLCTAHPYVQCTGPQRASLGRKQDQHWSHECPSLFQGILKKLKFMAFHWMLSRPSISKPAWCLGLSCVASHTSRVHQFNSGISKHRTFGFWFLLGMQ